MKKYTILLLVTAVLLTSLLSFVSLTEADDWRIKWTTLSYSSNRPAVGTDGTIYSTGGYFGVYGDSAEYSQLRAFNQEGEMLWAYTGGDNTASPSSVSSDGMIYYGDYSGILYAIYPDGTERWTYDIWSTIYNAPTIGTDGTFYTGNANGVFAIKPDSTFIWWAKDPYMSNTSPAIGSDGTIYVVSGAYPQDEQFYLYAINNGDGSVKWTSPIPVGYAYHTPAIGTDGSIYVKSSGDNVLYAFNSNGTENWTYTFGESMSGYPAEKSDPLVGSDGTIYVGAEDAKLYAINPDGTKKWVYDPDPDCTSLCDLGSPVQAADGTIYIVKGSYLYAVNPNGSTKWVFDSWDYRTSHGATPAIGPDGTIYIQSSYYGLMAITDNQSVSCEEATIFEDISMDIPYVKYMSGSEESWFSFHLEYAYFEGDDNLYFMLSQYELLDSGASDCDYATLTEYLEILIPHIKYEYGSAEFWFSLEMGYTYIEGDDDIYFMLTGYEELDG